MDIADNVVLTANSDIYKYGVFGSELHISGGFHIIADWVSNVGFRTSCVLVLVLFAFVVLGLVSSVLCQQIGWEERL